ncbi:MAG: RAMP superfamily CRISPR-associated protein [Bacteroidota bacterium]
MNPKTAPFDPLHHNYQLGVRILTPVHVGIGTDQAWERALDFFMQDGRLNIIEQSGVQRWLMNEPGRGTGSLLDEYLDLMGQIPLPYERLETLIRNSGIDLPAFRTHAFDYRGYETPPNQIQRHIRTGTGQLYLPGSSIKGAIRSAIYRYLYRILRVRHADSQTENNLIGSFDRSIMRFIRPFDVPFASSELVEVFLMNLYRKRVNWESDYKDMPSLTLETLRVGAQATQPMRLSIATGFLDMVEQGIKRPELLPSHLRKIIRRERPLEFLFGLINQHTLLHVDRELDFFRTYPQAEDLDRILEVLEDLQRDLLAMGEEPSRCILRMAWGSGFHSITGDWRFPDHLTTIHEPDERNKVYSQRLRSKEAARYKSRRLAEKNRGDYFAPMGFVELSLDSENE